MVNKYKKGYVFENKIVNKLKREGFQYVARTAGSHSAYDIIAIRNNILYLVQCKCKEMTESEKNTAIKKMPKLCRRLEIRDVLCYKEGSKNIFEEIEV